MTPDILQKEFLLVSRLELFAPKIDLVLGKDRPLSQLSVLCIPTASKFEDEPYWFEAETSPLKDRARHYREFDITGKTNAQVDAAMEEADIIYVTGGNTYCLLEQMHKCDFASSLSKAFTRGAFYIGASAGAIVACPEIDFIREMDDPSRASLQHFRGLGLTDLMVLPHLDHEKFRDVCNTIIAGWTHKRQMIGLYDNQGLHGLGNYCQVL